ncbi:hypothetical protein BGZ63DRAFT_368035 [Mariannaea sp. PMI_226]|nr:hypothetical protein BGZ63DRAFT_368035 [Mariannaea sp. PMI_226]
MARLSVSVLLIGLLGSSLVSALPEYNQEEQHRDADCDNGCFFGSFPGGSCTNDAACMCTQQKYREAYFCCMAEKCASHVLPDSIQRQHLECEARNMDFTFDVEKVCGIKMPTTTVTYIHSADPATTSDSSKHSETSAPGAPASASEHHTTGSATSDSVASTPATTTGSSTPTTPGASTTKTAVPTSSAPQTKFVFNGVAIVVAMSALLLW